MTVAIARPPARHAAPRPGRHRVHLRTVIGFRWSRLTAPVRALGRGALGFTAVYGLLLTYMITVAGWAVAKIS
jgi:hypothetical protein